MLSLIGALIGFAGSAVPSVIEHYKTKETNKTKLEILKVQGQATKDGATIDLSMFEAKATDNEHTRLINHDIALQRSSGFFGGLSKSVRPLITYAFFGLFMCIKITTLRVALESSEPINALLLLWDEDTQAIFASILAFWFGGRQIDKFRSK